MLLELRVSNFAIIDKIEMTFQGGLNILSGETGAGKSILLKSLSLLMGQKASSDDVKSGCKNATIEGLFDVSGRKDIAEALKDFDISFDDDTLIVRRLISSQGKSKIYLNDTIVSLQQLREIVSPLIHLTGQAVPLIEMTGQHDNRNLQSTSYHLELLDQYCGLLEAKHEYQTQFQKRNELSHELEKLKNDAQTQAQKLDYLVFQKNEIEAIELNPGDDVQLEGSVKRLKNSNKLLEFMNATNAALYSDEDSALNRINRVLKVADEAQRLDPEIAPLVEPLENAKVIIEDCLYEMEKHINQGTSDEESLSDLEEKLSHLRKLQKKFGATVEEIQQQHEEICSEIDKIENFDNHIKALETKILEITDKLTKSAKAMHKKRVSGASLLTDGVNEELLDLNMKGLIFEVQTDKLTDLNANGITDVEFLTKSSKSDKSRPLAKFASGGELSRILLSLKRTVGSSQFPRTYLFDEVDTGVSGETAQKVGRKLKSIAVGGQVICVTHLPQVASYADNHFLIQKVPTKDTVEMKVIELNSDKRINEVARLISGEQITQTSLDHAKQLIEQSAL